MLIKHLKEENYSNTIDLLENPPFSLPHCCGGSWLSVHQGDSPLHQQTPVTPCSQTPRPHCSHPISTPHQGGPCGVCHIHRWWLSLQRRHGSLQTQLPPRQWHEQMLIHGWLEREIHISIRNKVQEKKHGSNILL